MILPIEQQFAAPELCERLMELGAPTDTVCRWVIEEPDDAPWLALWDEYIQQWAEGAGYELVPAYSVAELGELLSTQENIGMAWYCDPHEADKGGWQWLDDGLGMFKELNTEADARASALIHLIETGQLKFEGVPNV